MEIYQEKLQAIKDNVPQVYEAGERKGYDAGYSEGYDAGYSKGYEHGGQEAYGAGVDAGKQAEYDRFWDEYQQNGNRTDYSGAFYGLGWNNDTFKPKYNIVDTRPLSTFRENLITGDVKALLDGMGVTMDFSGATSFSYTFYRCAAEVLPTVDISSATSEAYLFGYCQNLKTAAIVVGKITGFSNTFNKCTSLENLTVSGTIAKNGFSVQWSPNLTHDSLMSIINCLQDKSADTSGTEWVVTIGATNRAKLTSDELKVAQNKGWTVK